MLRTMSKVGPVGRVRLDDIEIALYEPDVWCEAYLRAIGKWEGYPIPP